MGGAGEFDRNTPTDVGKTYRMDGNSDDAQKHPHGRGEDPGRSSMVTGSLETPPRTWGRRRARLAVLASAGNTPTDVGKTVKKNIAVIGA